MTIPSRTAPPPPSGPASASARQHNFNANQGSNSAGFNDIMSGWTTPSSSANRTNYGSTSTNSGTSAKKPPPPRPPPPKTLPAAAGANTNQPKNIASLTSIFRRMKTNDNRSKDLFTLPPPPKATPHQHNGHKNGPAAATSSAFGSSSLQSPSHRDQQPSSVELISFDSPPQSPTPTQRSLGSWNSSLSFSSDVAAGTGGTSGLPQSGSMFGGVGSAATTTTHSESGFEDDFGMQAAFDPFSPEIGQMPVYGFPPTASAYGSTTAAQASGSSKPGSTFWSPEFLDPLCNGKTLVQPEPPLQTPTIIRPVAKSTTTGTAKANAMAAPSSQTIQQARTELRGGGNEGGPQRTGSRKPQQQQQQSYAIVLYQFDALQEGDLNLRPDERVVLLRQINDDWFFGRNQRGDEGMVPTTYIDIKIPLPDADDAAAGANSPPPQQPPPKFVAAPPAAEEGRPIRTLYTFMAQTQGDLSIGEGELLAVLHVINDDWWFGRTSDGRRGQFPAAYVELV